MDRSVPNKHLQYKKKTMSELIEDRTKRLSNGQNELRKKWLPEKYNPDIDKKKPL
ncbi:MAG: hypothetical protein RR642_14445 [Solibacillus sp.]